MVLQANEQLAGEGGAAILDAQLVGRHVVVVGAGAAAREWAERCRGHVGAGGSVRLLEVPGGEGEDGAGGAGQVGPVGCRDDCDGVSGALACMQRLCAP